LVPGIRVPVPSEVVSAVVLTLFVFIPLAVLAVAARLRCGVPLRWCGLRVRVLSWLAASVGLVLLGLLTYLAGVALGLVSGIGELGLLAAAAYVAAFAAVTTWSASRVDLEGAVFLVFLWIISMGLFIHVYVLLLPVMDPVHAVAIVFTVPVLMMLALTKLVTPEEEG